MQQKKCLRTLGAALTIVIATLTWASGAAGFQLDGEPDRAGTYNVLHLFTWAKNPSGNLIFDAAGNLYGTTFGGASSPEICRPEGCGVVYKLARNPKGAWTVSILHAFSGADGANPYTAGVIFDATGNLYGTTYGGGADGAGVVFKLKPNPKGSWTESVLYSFTGGADGGFPSGGLIFDAGGNLYGTTYGGGADGYGVVFKLTPNPDGTSTESVLYSFTGGADGATPYAGLIFDAAGNLYGTTFSGAESGVFKLARNPDGTWTESVLYGFTGGADGANPRAGVIFDAAGNLYGTTYDGGSAACTIVGRDGPECGAVFKLKPNPDGSWTESTLHSFTGGADGAGPVAGLTLDAAGNLYGTTAYGGSAACGCGVVFKLSPSSSGWSETVLHTFIGFGGVPLAPVIFGPAGNLYGTTFGGNPAFDYGLVFEITR